MDHGGNSGVVAGVGGVDGGVFCGGRVVVRGSVNAGEETLFEH